MLKKKSNEANFSYREAQKIYFSHKTTQWCLTNSQARELFSFVGVIKELFNWDNEVINDINQEEFLLSDVKKRKEFLWIIFSQRWIFTLLFVTAAAFVVVLKLWEKFMKRYILHNNLEPFLFPFILLTS